MIRKIWFFEDSIEIPGGASDKKPPANLGDAQEVGSIPGLKRSPGVRNAIHSSILAWKISMNRRAWQAMVHGVAKCWT